MDGSWTGRGRVVDRVVRNFRICGPVAYGQYFHAKCYLIYYSPRNLNGLALVAHYCSIGLETENWSDQARLSIASLLVFEARLLLLSRSRQLSTPNHLPASSAFSI